MAFPHDKHLSTLTAFRFIAAFMVFGFHFFNFPDEYVLLNRMFSRGYLGVDFFFILSGFVLGYTYFQKSQNGPFPKKNFLLHRAARIFPVYYLALLLSLPLFIQKMLALSPIERLYVSTTIPLSLTFTQSFSGLAITQSYWNVPSWSLSVELFFYLLFPFISMKLMKSSHVVKNLLLLFLINACFFFGVSALPESVEFLDKSWDTAFRNLPFYHLPQFLIGNLLSLLFFRIKNKKATEISLGFFLFNCLIITLFFSSLDEKFLISGNPFIVFSFAGFILFSALIDKYINSYVPFFFILLGEASYSLYILQAPCKALLQQVWSNVFKMAEVKGFYYALFISVFTIVLSLLSYRFYETPLKNKINSVAPK